MKAKTKRVVTAMLAVVMLLTTMLPLTASAASGVTMDLTDCHVSWDYTLTDEEGNTFSAAYGRRPRTTSISVRASARISAKCMTTPPSARG